MNRLPAWLGLVALISVCPTAHAQSIADEAVRDALRRIGAPSPFPPGEAEAAPPAAPAEVLLRGERAVIADYHVEIWAPPSLDGTARYRVRMAYVSRGGTKTDGFKFMGDDPVERLRGSTLDGQQMATRRPGGYREVRVEYDLPRPDAQGYQSIVLEFEQRMRTSGLRERSLAVPWAHRFGIPVYATRYVVHLPEGHEGWAPDWTCESEGAGQLCEARYERLTPLLLNVSVPMTLRTFERPLSAAFGFIGFFIIAVGLGYRRRLVTGGETVPDERAYDDDAGEKPDVGYRAPAVLPGLPGVVRLGSDARNNLIGRSIGAAICAGLPVAFTALGSASGAWFWAVIIAAGLVSLAYVYAEQHWHALLLVPAVVAAVAYNFEAIPCLVLYGAMGGPFFEAFLRDPSGFMEAAASSGGGGGGSSCSSCSSCGSSCGGGCGGGCGGCGG